MAIQIVIDHTGDTRHEFNSADKAALADAEARFFAVLWRKRHSVCANFGPSTGWPQCLNQNSIAYAYDFVMFFNEQNIPTQGIGASPCDSSQNGILVGLRKPEEPSQASVQFLEILRSAGLKVKNTGTIYLTEHTSSAI